MLRRAILCSCAALATAAAGADAQTPPVTTPNGETVSATGRLIVAKEVAPGGRLQPLPHGLLRPVRLQQRRHGKWVDRGDPVTANGQHAALPAPVAPGELKLRALGADGQVTRASIVRVRPLILDAVGDVNLGDGPGARIERSGARYPWASVGPRLRAADIAFGNLECAVSTRGSAQAKEFTFRGRPSSLAVARQVAGLDVVNLANNHAGDFGTNALLDTLRTARANSILPIGAGANESAAYRPQVVERLGLKIAFVGFSVIGPISFRANGDHPGTAWGSPARVRSAVASARNRADVVIATFHWGIERDFHESVQQRQLAKIALDAGATAVIGAHPHVLQPIRTPPGRLIAYSLGNFIFSATSPGTERTGILEIRLGARRVLGHRFISARIVDSRPILRTAT